MASPDHLSKFQISPLTVPEILEHILSYVDTSTVIKSVPLVCRLWLLVGRNRANRVFEWSVFMLDPSNDRILSRLNKADIFCCRLSRSRGAPYELTNLWEAIKKNFAIQSGTVDDTFFDSTSIDATITTPTKGDDASNVNSSGIQQLILDGPIPLSVLSQNFLPYFPHLRVLKIYATHATQNESYVYTIMQHMKCLEILHLQHMGTMSTCLQLQGPWVDKGVETTTPTKYCLRSLVIIKAMLQQHDLEEFLAMCPLLKVLKLELLQRTYDGAPFYDPARLFQYIQNLSLNLTVFHYSDRSSRSDPILEQKLNLDLIPLATQRTLRGNQFTPMLVRALDKLPNVLTILELIGACDYLHDYLCESPFLLHLKAPTTNLSLQHLDIHTKSKQDISHPLIPKVWACRSLRTLQLRFCRAWDRVRNPKETSLIVFGYISRVCPLLQVLEIQGPELQMDEITVLYDDGFDFDLANGLVLLARLKQLQRLVIGACDPDRPIQVLVERVDIDWMVASGYTEERRQERQKVIDSWATEIESNLKTLAIRDSLLSLETSSKEPSVISGTESNLLYNLRYLGLRIDVKLMLEEMDRSTGNSSSGSNSNNSHNHFECWPHLEEISIYCRRYQGFLKEQEVDRLLNVKNLAVKGK
ncbi:hypothetical protein FBU30_002872 [Linnemannia zychae]|nr:hypothetical protein FBU30_002872 [Linnemannia zychae]